MVDDVENTMLLRSRLTDMTVQRALSTAGGSEFPTVYQTPRGLPALYNHSQNGKNFHLYDNVV